MLLISLVSIRLKAERLEMQICYSSLSKDSKPTPFECTVGDYTYGTQSVGELKTSGNMDKAGTGGEWNTAPPLDVPTEV